MRKRTINYQLVQTVLLAGGLYLTSTFSHAGIVEATQAVEKKDFKTAQIEFESAADIGNAEAQFNLGVMHFQGQLGQVDKIKSMAWFFLASEYQYPNARRFAEEIYGSLEKSEQAKAITYTEQKIAEIGAQALTKRLYPVITQSKAEKQVITQSAKMLVQGELYYDPGSFARANNNSAIQRLNRNPSLINNLSKVLVNDDSGMVQIQYDVAVDGRVREPEVVFSWPKARFNSASIESLLNSTFKPAFSAQKPVTQYGLVQNFYFGVNGVVSLRESYPNLYKAFKKLQNAADENVSSKYLYACFLRGYKRLLSESEYESFEPILLELAEQGVNVAQFDYAQYQIYEKNDLEAGLPWLIKAAKHGYADAEYKLGDLAMQPTSAYLKQDYQKAEYWLSKAAKQSHRLAQHKWVELKVLKKNVNKTFATQALTWFSELDDDARTPKTYYLMAQMHLTLDDQSKAKKYLSQAVQIGQDYHWNVADWKKLQAQLNG